MADILVEITLDITVDLMDYISVACLISLSGQYIRSMVIGSQLEDEEHNTHIEHFVPKTNL